jgi:hypothetical protein
VTSLADLARRQSDQWDLKREARRLMAAMADAAVAEANQQAAETPDDHVKVAAAYAAATGAVAAVHASIRDGG